MQNQNGNQSGKRSLQMGFVSNVFESNNNECEQSIIEEREDPEVNVFTGAGDRTLQINKTTSQLQQAIIKVNQQIEQQESDESDFDEFEYGVNLQVPANSKIS